MSLSLGKCFNDDEPSNLSIVRERSDGTRFVDVFCFGSYHKKTDFLVERDYDVQEGKKTAVGDQKSVRGRKLLTVGVNFTTTER